MTAQLNRNESSNAYIGVIVRLNPDWRVIECRLGMQWIFQHGKIRHGTDWRGRSFSQTRSEADR